MTKRLTTKQEELVFKNLKLVHYFVHKSKVAPSDYDDIVSIGTIGLSKAAATFDESKNIKFATYAAMCIKNEIFMYLKKQSKHPKVVSIESLITTDKNGNELTLGDTSECPNSNFEERIQDRDSLERIINIILNLLKSKKRLIMLYKMANVGLRYIAEILNLSRSYISLTVKRAREELREYLTTEQQIDGGFSMSITDTSYRLTFSSSDVKNFNKIFALLLQKPTITFTLPDFKIVCNKKRIVIQVPACPEAFSFIAQIIQEIDEFAINYISDESIINATEDTIKEIEESEGKSTMTERKTDSAAKETTVEANDDLKTNIIIEDSNLNKTDQIISDNLSTSVEVDKEDLEEETTIRKQNKVKIVRDYMLTLETFTVKELKSYFPDMDKSSINNAIYLAKSNGLITSIGKGKYATKKD